jgi:hypothetical protein
VGEVRFDITFDGAQSSRAPLGDRCCIARCAQSDRHEVSQLGDDQLPHLRRGEYSVIDQCAHVVRQVQRAVPCGIGRRTASSILHTSGVSDARGSRTM